MNIIPLQPQFFMRTNVKITSFFNGFWDSKQKKFKDDIFKEMQVDPMLTALIKKFAIFGYILTDISDPKRSSRKFLKIFIPK